MKELGLRNRFRINLYKLVILFLIAAVAIPMVGCGDDDDDVQVEGNGTTIEVQAIESPFLICASRNPEGVGFDFVSSKPGVAYNMSEAPELEYDLLVKVIKAENPEGEVKGNPYADLFGDADGPADTAMAFDASSLDSIPTGDAGYNALTKVTAEITAGLKKDTAGFDLSGVKKGDMGFPLYGGEGNVGVQYKKLVIGDKWKKPAKNTEGETRPSGDEQVWVIKTREGRHVKLMFWDFPAKGAPTATGYVAIKWTLLD